MTAGAAEPIAALDWARIETDLAARGFALTGRILDAAMCASLVGAYAESTRYRSRVVMAHHGFGSGEYKYYAYPLPVVVDELRSTIYPHLAPIANRWSADMRSAVTYPPTLDAMLSRCHAAGQAQPTPLILSYSAGDYNCLHQDIYGEHVFPFQLAILLDEPGRDFLGGEFVLVEQRPRMQSRADVVPLAQGEGVIFAVNARPVRGTRGTYRTALRHGVATIRAGRRHTLGIIFHDGK